MAESYDLEFREPSSSRYFLVTIAQEEFAKAFLLLLISEDIIPFDTDVQQAMRDHACKHPVGMWMDYAIMILCPLGISGSIIGHHPQILLFGYFWVCFWV